MLLRRMLSYIYRLVYNDLKKETPKTDASFDPILAFFVFSMKLN